MLILILASLYSITACGRGEANDIGAATSETPAVSTTTAGSTATPKAKETAANSATKDAPNETTTPEPDAQANIPAGTLLAPVVETLSVFPGVLRTMTMTKEEVISIMGDHETYENISQAYSVYTWDEKNLVLEYDSLSGKLRAIRIAERTLFLSGASYKRADLNQDGILEGICAYESFPEANATANNTVEGAVRRVGRVSVIDEKTGQSLGESFVKAFEGYSTLSVLLSFGAEKECLIVLDTQSDWECDVLTYKDGQLNGVLPTEAAGLEDAVVNRSPQKPDTVQFQLASAGLAFDCLIPDRLQEALKKQKFEYRFVINRKPVVADGSLTLQVRNSLQVKLGDAADLEGVLIGRYVDIGQVGQEFRYMGSGKWKLLRTGGMPKYTGVEEGGNVTLEDLTVGPAILFAALYDYTDTFSLDPKTYANADLIGGISFLWEGTRIDVVNARIADITIYKDSLHKTVRGLMVGDSKSEALALYGQPDLGYFEDKVWTYWFYRDFFDQEPILSPDYFSITFDGDRVSRIAMHGYVPID